MSNKWCCDLCNCICNSELDWEVHLSGKKHKKNMTKKKFRPQKFFLAEFPTLPGKSPTHEVNNTGDSPTSVWERINLVTMGNEVVIGVEPEEKRKVVHKQSKEKITNEIVEEYPESKENENQGKEEKEVKKSENMEKKKIEEPVLSRKKRPPKYIQTTGYSPQKIMNMRNVPNIMFNPPINMKMNPPMNMQMNPPMNMQMNPPMNNLNLMIQNIMQKIQYMEKFMISVNERFRNMENKIIQIDGRVGDLEREFSKRVMDQKLRFFKDGSKTSLFQESGDVFSPESLNY